MNALGSGGNEEKMGECCFGIKQITFILVVKNPPAKAGDIRDLGSIPGLGRYPGEENGNLLQYSGLENPAEEPGRLQSMGLQSQT